MKYLLLIVLMPFSYRVSCQTNEFAPIGAKWWYNFEEFSAVGYKTLESVGDTIIEGHTCRVLSCTLYYADFSYPEPEYDTVSNPLWNIYIYSDSGIVYLYANDEFYVLYDFTAVVGDSWLVWGADLVTECDSTGMVEVYDASTVNINGFDLRQLYVDSVPGDYWTFGNNPIIERIGSLEYLLPNPRACLIDFSQGSALRCYYDPEFGYYQVDTSFSCDYILSVDDPITPGQVEIWPNPVVNTFYITSSEFSNETYITVFELSGKVIEKRMLNQSVIMIDTTLWPGNMYLIGVTSPFSSGLYKVVKF